MKAGESAKFPRGRALGFVLSPIFWKLGRVRPVYVKQTHSAFSLLSGTSNGMTGVEKNHNKPK